MKTEANHNPVSTSSVSGRRSVHYQSYDELLADAEQLSIQPTRAIGNWSVGQILRHLALSMDVMIDGAPFSLPGPVQFLIRILLKGRLLKNGLRPGFRIPAKASSLVPPETTPGEGLALLRTAIERLRSTSRRAPHPAFGVCSSRDWDEFQLRHCELHMSFIVPEN